MNLDESKRHRKITCITSAEITPPILLRRRLSAPETIMRKHLLAQQRSSSQDSYRSSESDTQSCPRGSDPNLTSRHKHKHVDDIRKSTLMKRFWESSKGNINFPSSYSEWQYSFGSRSKQGSSPEHRSMKRQSPARRTQSTFSINTPKSEEDSYVVYSSNLTESTSRTEEPSDCYPVSTETQSESVNNQMATGRLTKAYRISNDGISDVTDNTQMPGTLPIKYQFVINENEDDYEFVHQPSETTNATEGSTNLNVITNVQLSQSTLNMIFNQVMQDVLQKPKEATISNDNLVKQKAYNFKANLDNASQKSDNSILNSKIQSNKKVISEVNAGSPYKSRDSPSVPRLSAWPQTTSMEVNISSNDSLDKDSDTSLVDSLEDPTSPRFKVQRKTNIRKETESKTKSQQKGDVIEEDFQKKSIKKSSVFYIPIDDKSLDSDSPQVVSERLPNKLKEKLIKRQLKREEKRLQERMKAFDIENGNVGAYLSTSPESSSVTHKTLKGTSKAKRNSNTTKMTLPQIDLKKDYDKSLRSTYTQRSLNKYRESIESNNKTTKSFWLPKTRPKQATNFQSKQSTSTTSTKHVEILEIMEIVEPDRGIHLTPKTKSRIPVFQHTNYNSYTKLPKLVKPKPTFLDFDTIARVDPKLDQLIANILIDSLNHEDCNNKNQPLPKQRATSSEGETESKNESNNNPSNLIEHAAEILTKQVLDNNNLESPKLEEGMDNVQLDEIPKGWITFYMLQKNQSPDSTSDEGPKTASKSTQYVQDYYEGNSARISEESDSDCMATHRNKLRRRSKHLPDGWSVTFNNNNNGGEPAPEVEIKFKFPQLAKIGKQKQTQNQGLNFEDACGNNEKSEIDKSKLYLKDPSNATNRKRFTTITPRPTKTSRQRTMMHRRRHFQPELNVRMPEVLSISGNALSQIRKLPRLSEQDLKLLLLNFKQRQLEQHQRQVNQ